MAYIESDFPIEKVDEIAYYESNARKPIYHIHKWFARRVGCTFRALMLSVSGNENPMADFYKKVELKNGEGKPAVILDPFMGGGTTMVEGVRLSAKMIGVDVNPLAFFITKKELEEIDYEGVFTAFSRIEEKLKAKITSYYKTTCKRGHSADVMYVFWVKSVRCRNCKKETQLYKSFIIAKLKHEWVYQCAECGNIFHEKTGQNLLFCPECLCEFNPAKGSSGGKTYTCRECRSEGVILEAVDEKGPPEHRMFCIEYYCPVCGRDYKRPDDADLALYEKAGAEFLERKESLSGRLIPDQKIPYGEKTREQLNYKYRYWYQMFNERQLLCLSMILDEILKIEDRSVREFFLITFSDTLNANNMFTLYNTIRLEVEPLFGGHHF
jgi:adenine-specific DNA methylase